ncbi:MAG TPA: exo-alpha-sialidase, partial [Chryseolinea sp.]
MKGFYTLVFLVLIYCSYAQHGNNVSAANALATKNPINGIRIAWDHSTLKQLSLAEARYSGYARMIKLHDGVLYCVYESDKAVLAINSADGGRHWSRPVVVASPKNNIACAVPEVLQLQDGSLLVSYNLRPPANNNNPEKRFSIQVRRSLNGGTTWSQPVEVYKAGHEFKNG